MSRLKHKGEIMKKKVFPTLGAIITVITIVVFELIFVAGKYEIVAEWIRHYSRTISLIFLSILSIVIIITVNGIVWKNDNGKKGIYPQTIIGILLIAIFVAVKIFDIWQ